MVAVYVYVEAQHDVAYRRHVRSAVSAMGAHLDEQFRTRVSLVETLRHELEMGVVTPGPGFVARASDLQRTLHGFQAINLADENGVIVQVVPLEPNRSALGRDLTQNAIAAPYLAAARTTGEVRLSEPLELYQGGIGIVGYLPVHGGRQGFVNAVFRLQPLVEALATSPLGAGIDLELHRGGERVYPFASSDGLYRDALVAPMGFGDGLSLVAVPSDDLRRSFHAPTTPALLVLALGSALVVAFLAYRSQAVRLRRKEEARRLARGERLEALGTLAGGIAHDVNNVLAVLTTGLDLLGERLEPSGAYDRELEQLHRACDDAARLTRQLLVLARNHPPTDRPFDLDAMLGAHERVFASLLGKGRALRLELGAHGFELHGDEAVIRQAVVNLLMNARDAMPHGGTVTLATRVEGRTCRLTLTDDGHGMPASVVDRIFDPFFTTKDVGQGTGLGLATVYSAVQQHGGTVEVASVEGQGTRFELGLPCRLAATPVPARPTLPRASGGVRLLLVEDDPGLREAFGLALRRAGFEVLEARDGPAALARLEGERAVDVLVTDVRMPGMGGLELARRVRQRFEAVEVVFCTGFADGEPLETLQGPEPVVLQKPFPLRDLVDTVRARCGPAEG